MIVQYCTVSRLSRTVISIERTLAPPGSNVGLYFIKVTVSQMVVRLIRYGCLMFLTAGRKPLVQDRRTTSCVSRREPDCANPKCRVEEPSFIASQQERCVVQ